MQLRSEETGAWAGLEGELRLQPTVLLLWSQAQRSLMSVKPLNYGEWKSINPPPTFNSSHLVPLSHRGWILIFASFHRWHLKVKGSRFGPRFHMEQVDMFAPPPSPTNMPLCYKARFIYGLIFTKWISWLQLSECRRENKKSKLQLARVCRQGDICRI